MNLAEILGILQTKCEIKNWIVESTHKKLTLSLCVTISGCIQRIRNGWGTQSLFSKTSLLQPNDLFLVTRVENILSPKKRQKFTKLPGSEQMTGKQGRQNWLKFPLGLSRTCRGSNWTRFDFFEPLTQTLTKDRLKFYFRTHDRIFKTCWLHRAKKKCDICWGYCVSDSRY